MRTFEELLGFLLLLLKLGQTSAALVQLNSQTVLLFLQLLNQMQTHVNRNTSFFTCFMQI